MLFIKKYNVNFIDFNIGFKYVYLMFKKVIYVYNLSDYELVKEIKHTNIKHIHTLSSNKYILGVSYNSVVVYGPKYTICHIYDIKKHMRLKVVNNFLIIQYFDSIKIINISNYGDNITLYGIHGDFGIYKKYIYYFYKNKVFVLDSISKILLFGSDSMDIDRLSKLPKELFSQIMDNLNERETLSWT